MKIKHFRGVFARDCLPKKPKSMECGIINLEDHTGYGSHWVCYYKTPTISYYFDSFGDTRPPIELDKYLGEKRLWYGGNRIQNYEDPPICGHLCLLFLKEVGECYDFDNVLTVLNTKMYDLKKMLLS